MVVDNTKGCIGMRRIHIDKLKTGMIISKPIYSSSGIKLLSEGAELTDKNIDKIKEIGLRHVYITDELSEGIVVEMMIKEETRHETKRVLKNSVEKIKSGCFDSSEDIMKQINTVIEEVLNNPRVMFSVQEIRDKNEYAFLHAINVCLISCVLGKRMNYNEVQLKHLALGALLHDVGKIKLRIEVIKYRHEYLEDEYELYKLHTEEGFMMIQELPNASLTAANVARQHHENYDGTGFPLGLKGDAIHEFARIVAIANEYDNLMFNLPMGMHIKNYEVFEAIIAKSYTFFDPFIVDIFKKSISPYPIGIGVVLSNGQVGIVSRLNEEFPTRPVIRIVDEKTRTIIGEVDLVKNTTLFIQDEKDIDK